MAEGEAGLAHGVELRVLPGHAEGSGDRPVRGWVWVVVGLLVTGLGRLMWSGAGPEGDGEALVGGLLWILGIVVAGVGVVAEGVLVGMRRWQHESGRPVR